MIPKAARGRARSFEDQQMIFGQRGDARLGCGSGNHDGGVIRFGVRNANRAQNFEPGLWIGPLTWNAAPRTDG